MPTDTTAEQKAREALTENPFPDMPFVRIGDAGIVIATGYSEALHRLLRWVPHAKWRASERSWLVPFSGAEAVRAVLPEIARLAEAARELDGPSPRSGQAGAGKPADLLESLTEAARLLHGADWRAVLIRENSGSPIADWIDGKCLPSPADPVFEAFADRLRQEASALTRAAERLDAACGARRDNDRG